jgi:hypothetical protein
MAVNHQEVGIVIHNQSRIVDELRMLLVSGEPLDSAVRCLHLDRGIGLLWIVAAVVVVVGLDSADAQRLVIQATMNDREEKAP